MSTSTRRVRSSSTRDRRRPARRARARRRRTGGSGRRARRCDAGAPSAGARSPRPSTTSCPWAHVSMTRAVAKDIADIGPAIHGTRSLGSRLPQVCDRRPARRAPPFEHLGAGHRPALRLELVDQPVGVGEELGEARAPKASASVSATVASSSATARCAIVVADVPARRGRRRAPGTVGVDAGDDRVELRLLGLEVVEQRVVVGLTGAETTLRRERSLTSGGWRTRCSSATSCCRTCSRSCAGRSPTRSRCRTSTVATSRAVSSTRRSCAGPTRTGASACTSGEHVVTMLPELVRGLLRVARSRRGCGADRGAGQQHVPRRDAAVPDRQLGRARSSSSASATCRSSRRCTATSRASDGRRPRRDDGAHRHRAPGRRPATSSSPAPRPGPTSRGRTTGTSRRSSTRRARPARRRACSCRGGRSGRS